MIGYGMTHQLTVPKMATSGCADKIAKAIKGVDANAIVQANPKTKLVSVETIVSEVAIKKALAAIGYRIV